MNEDGKHQDMAQQSEHDRELAGQLNLLEAIDQLITPEHVAKRFAELLDALGEGAPAAAASAPRPTAGPSSGL